MRAGIGESKAQEKPSSFSTNAKASEHSRTKVEVFTVVLPSPDTYASRPFHFGDGTPDFLQAWSSRRYNLETQL
jgi:hypothetical protein